MAIQIASFSFLSDTTLEMVLTWESKRCRQTFAYGYIDIDLAANAMLEFSNSITDTEPIIGMQQTSVDVKGMDLDFSERWDIKQRKRKVDRILNIKW